MPRLAAVVLAGFLAAGTAVQSVESEDAAVLHEEALAAAALAEADECGSADGDGGASGTCALSALQRRALAKRPSEVLLQAGDAQAPDEFSAGPKAKGGACSPTFNPRYSKTDQDCRATRACCDPAMTCFEKGPAWAGCMRSCAPGVRSDEPQQYRHPWSCRVLSGAGAQSPAQSTTPTPGFQNPVMQQDQGGGCSEHPGLSYKLDWAAQGGSFFDGWDFQWEDHNHGAAEYLAKDAAVAQGVAQAHATHAILGAGPSSKQYKYKRASAKIATQKTWKYFLAMMRYTHLPFGCGVWPAFWTNAPGDQWPEGGELDIFEYVNDGPQQTSFHTGQSNRCRLNAAAVNRCAQMPDANRMNYDCLTRYPKQLGCAPNTQPLQSGQSWAGRPGVVAVEWTASFLKVFFIPDGQVPGDVNSNQPKPDTWDRFLISHYPFGASNKADPSGCPNPAEVMKAQQLVLNINFCGDWAAKVWKQSSCTRTVRQANGCRATDPLLEYAPDQDCCTQFIWDPQGQYGADAYLKKTAFFNISYIKVFQAS